jgi:hypothetical protein
MTLRARLAFTWDAICAVPSHPELIPLMAKLAAIRVVLVVGCWWTGTTPDDLRRERHRRKRLQILTGRHALG